MIILALAVLASLLDWLYPLGVQADVMIAPFVIPAIIAAVGIGADLLRQRAAGRSVAAQQKMYEDWLKERSQGVSDLIKQLGANGINIFGPQTSTNNMVNNSTSTSRTNSTTKTSTRPVITDQYKELEGMFRGLMTNRLQKGATLPYGYKEKGARDINATYAGAESAARNLAARRGLSGEAALGLAMPIETGRARNIADFLVDVPLKERQLQTEDIELAGRLAQIFGLGSDSVSNTLSNTVGTSQGTSSSTSTTPPNLSALMALLLPPDPTGRPTTAGQGANMGAAGLEGVSQLLAYLYGQGALGGRGGAPSCWINGQYVCGT